MAVYTRLNSEEISLWAKRFRLGTLKSHRGIAAGTVNTIYRVDTSAGRFALRLLEDRSRRDADFEAALVAYLRRGPELAAVIAPMKIARGMPLRLGQSPSVWTRQARQHVSVFAWLAGRPLAKAAIQKIHVEQIGRFLGALHQGQRGFRRRRRFLFDPARMREMYTVDWEKLGRVERDVLKGVRKTLLNSQWRGGRADNLRWGIVHGDLFIDNAHFQRDKLVGVLDFEMAASGPLLLDVAVAVCEWAFNDRGRFFPGHARALLRGYGSMDRTDAALLYDLCLFAAARFTWTRVHDFVLSEREAEMRTAKRYTDFLSRHQRLLDLGRTGFIKALA